MVCFEICTFLIYTDTLDPNDVAAEMAAECFSFQLRQKLVLADFITNIQVPFSIRQSIG